MKINLQEFKAIVTWINYIYIYIYIYIYTRAHMYVLVCNFVVIVYDDNYDSNINNNS